MAKLEGSVLGFLNLDDDERVVPKGDYVDALNIRKTISAGGVPSPAYNVLGNTLVNYSLPAGENTCVGAIVHEETNNLFYFVHNTLSDHSILQYNTITGNITLVAQDRFLNLKKNAFVTGQAINAIDDSGVLLYFTDNINPPRKINVKRAILHQQGDFSNGYATEFSSGTDAQKAQFYDHIKHPPLAPLTFEYFTDNTKRYNNLKDEVWQFRYQYIYDDDEVSALSPWSKLAISPNQKFNNIDLPQEYLVDFNGLRLNIPTSQNCVREIQVTFRAGNNGDEFVLKRVDNTPENSTTTIDFFNSSVANVLATNESTKNYDGVPLLAKDFKIKGQRGFFANTLDGYDNVEASGGVGVGYEPEPGESTTEDIVVTISNSQAALIRIDFNGVTSVEQGKTFTVNFRLERAPLSPSGSVFTSYAYSNIYTASSTDTRADVVDFFANDLRTYIYNNTFTYVAKVTSTHILIQLSGYRNFFGYYITDSSAVYDANFAVKTFKSGAFHPIGIIYLDRANRANTVSKLAEPYVKWYTERDGDIEGYGAATLGVRVDNTPPIWAESYHIVYAGNSTVDEFLQYTCVGAYKEFVGTPNKTDRLYISMRNFKGSDSSWKENTRGKPDYAFVEGDRVRIKSYYDPVSGREIPEGYFDFKVVDFKILDQDADTNPIYNSGDPVRTSGYFLILENPGIEGFSTEDGVDIIGNGGSSNWYKENFSEGAYFEIYRKKPQTENTVYYEVGERYEIGNAGLSSRYHKGGVRDQNESVSVAGLVPETAGTFNYIDANTTDNKFVVGDEIKLVDDNSSLLLGIFTINRVQGRASTTRLFIDGTISSGTFSGAYTINLLTEGAATTLDTGDVWLKPRTFFEKNVTAGNPFLVSNQWVEDYYANDFIDSDSWDRGRVWAFSPDNKQLRRKATLYNTEKFFSDTNFNGLSSINLALTPFFDYDQSFGSIQAIRSHNDGLVLWKENKVSLAPVDRRIIESTDGGQISTASDTVLSQERFYAGDYGIGLNPESLSGGDGRWYWLDPKRGKFLRLSNDGITPVSDYKMRSYFYRETKLYQQNYGGAKFFGGYDRENEEAIITFPQVTSGAVVVTPSQTPVISPLPNSTEVSGNIFTTVDIQQGTPKTRTWGSETRTWGEIDETWDEWGGTEYDTSEIAERGIVEVPADKISNSAEPIYVTYKTATGDVVARGTLNIDESRIEVPTTGTDPAHPIAVTTTTAGTAECVAFYEPANRWSTFYSFTPEMFAVISNIFVSWEDGALYVHNGNTTRNNFYGVQYNSEISPIVNDAPYDAKMFFAAGLEATTTWDAVFTTDLSTASADETRWVDKEGTYYTDIPMCYSGTTVSNIIGLSDVVDVTGNNVEVARYATNGLFVGDMVYNSGTSIGTITAIDSDTNILTLTSSGSLSSGDYVYVQRNLQIEGDRLRGVYCRIDLTSDDTTETELYKLDLEAKKSYI